MRRLISMSKFHGCGAILSLKHLRCKQHGTWLGHISWIRGSLRRAARGQRAKQDEMRVAGIDIPCLVLTKPSRNVPCRGFGMAVMKLRSKAAPVFLSTDLAASVRQLLH